MNYYPHLLIDLVGVRQVRTLPLVYVITTPDFEFIKVGKSTSFKQRLINIQSGCPMDLSLWLGIRTPRPNQVEAALHELLKHCSVRGEWFTPDSGDLDEILHFCAETNLKIKEAHRALLQT